MPTIVRPPPHLVGVNTDVIATSAADVLRYVPGYGPPRYDILRTSFDSLDGSPGVVPRGHGFSNTIIRAFQQDLHLTLRPDDVWLAIVVQLSFFVNGTGRPEALRNKFVEHKGRKHIVVDARPAHIATVDIGVILTQLVQLVKSSIKDPVATKLLLDFSTTTENDRATAAIAFLGTMQNYFSYEIRVGCGFPSVTPLGDREDWAKMLDSIQLLASLSDETVEWAACLSKVLEYMVASFDRPEDADVKSFWMRAVHESGGNGSGTLVKLIGWITAFSWWDASGDRQKTFNSQSAGGSRLALDGVKFPVISAEHIPASVTTRPVVVLDDTRGSEQGGWKIEAEFVAGIPGFQVQDASGTAVRPISGWWLIERHRRRQLTQK
ncbi:hypothetical protein CORC01_14093 [Colletotrichum orchidophilum]|uniref:Uncharacterized protein n=1 Tax=Colletotrichum orchidophilum TaxID=1209926 RepID=A0A1G4AN53_9PEZI|nr:uncharacterized protein CORC01_14093 [Colletotrichum orchidophilum]OHE90609.1 hypothetical protein CORC01_14093 [Colletotrichum orchidophilum]